MDNIQEILNKFNKTLLDIITVLTDILDLIDKKDGSCTVKLIYDDDSDAFEMWEKCFFLPRKGEIIIKYDKAYRIQEVVYKTGVLWYVELYLHFENFTKNQDQVLIRG